MNHHASFARAPRDGTSRLGTRENGSFPAHSRAVFIVLLAAALVGGCVAAVGAVLVTSVDMALDRRTPGVYIDDNVVETKLRNAFSADPLFGEDVNLSVTSVNGVVLLTGEVPRPEQAHKAVEIGRGFAEVRRVVNQLAVTAKSSPGSRAGDTWTTAKVKLALLQDPEIESHHVKVVTERGNVFLMGLVTREEADRIVAVARGVRGVARITKVFEYI